MRWNLKARVGRLITDSIISAYEVLYPMNTRKTGRVWSMTLKLYISKSYDRME